MTKRETDRVAVAVCDPRVMMSLLLADTAAYEKRDIPLRFTLDPTALSIAASASFIFDRLTSEPVVLLGMEDLIGINFSEMFADTIKRVQDVDFFDFNPAQYVPHSAREPLHRVRNFLDSINRADERVAHLSRRPAGTVDAAVRSAVAHARFAKLPLVCSALDGVSEPVVGTTLASVGPAFEVLSEVLSVEVPDLRVESLADLLDIRGAAGAEAFRQVFREFLWELEKVAEDDLRATESVIVRWNRIKNEATDLLVNEFRNDIQGWGAVSAGMSVLLGVAGFIPGASLFAGAASLSKDTAELTKRLERKRSREYGFLSFLADLRSRTPR